MSEVIYDFDTVVRHADGLSIKYDFTGRGRPQDVLPLWVADMDFSAPPAVTEALSELAGRGIFAYSEPDAAYIEALTGWFARRHGWQVDPAWLQVTPGVVVALYLAVKAFTAPGDAVIIQQPNYHPFEEAVLGTGRRLIVSELVQGPDGRYRMDYEDFEQRIVDNDVRLFILCSPHNPVGRVWTREELAKAGEICLRHGVVVVSDEIHQDFIYPGYRHEVFADISPELAAVTVTCTAPSKTFNLAGLQNSNVFIANESLRARFKEAYARAGLSQPNVAGLVACRAAYAHGDAWLTQLVAYLDENMNLVRDAVCGWEGVRFDKPEGTYLAWLDCRALGLSDRELRELFTEKARVWLSDGFGFGKGGSGFMRLNAASPASVVQEGLDRITRALSAR